MISDINMRVNVSFTLSEKEVEYLIGRAIVHGYQRSEPTKTWSRNEQKEAVRFALRNKLKEIKWISQ